MEAAALVDSIQALPSIDQVVILTMLAGQLGLFVNHEPLPEPMSYLYHWAPADRAEAYIVEVQRPDSTGTYGPWTMTAVTQDTIAAILARPPGGERVRAMGLNTDPETGETRSGEWSPASKTGSKLR